MVLVQKWPFFQPYFFWQYWPGKVSFTIFKNKKNAFLGYKKSKKSKKCHFPKGVNPWFRSKNCHFSIFFFGNIGQENVFYDILEQKNAFLGNKNKKLKKSKNWHFSKTHGFGPKMAIFQLFFQQYRQGSCLFRYSRTKKSLSRLWQQEVNKVKKLTFFQRG